MRLVDVHCHLQASVFNGKLDRVIDRAVNNEVVRIINNGTCPDDWNKCIEIGLQYEMIRTALGIHPWYIPNNYAEGLITLETVKRISAIGEIGLDKRHTKIPYNIQREVFEKQLIIAKERNLPAIIHCITDYQDLLEIFKKIGLPEKGCVLHAFNGNKETAEAFAKYKVYFSIGGVVTYRDSKKREEMIKSIYPEKFLMETDSPDLPPIEMKGKTNEPSNILYIAEACSEILGIASTRIADSAFVNAGNIFGKVR